MFEHIYFADDFRSFSDLTLCVNKSIFYMFTILYKIKRLSCRRAFLGFALKYLYDA